MDTPKRWFGKGGSAPFKYGHFLVSMLNFQGAMDVSPAMSTTCHHLQGLKFTAAEAAAAAAGAAATQVTMAAGKAKMQVVKVGAVFF